MIIWGASIVIAVITTDCNEFNCVKSPDNVGWYKQINKTSVEY